VVTSTSSRLLGFRVLRPYPDPVWRRVAKDQTVACLGGAYGGELPSAPAFARPLPAVRMTRRHTRLIGIEMRPMQSEAVRDLGVPQREFVSESGGAVRAEQEALDPSL